MDNTGKYFIARNKCNLKEVKKMPTEKVMTIKELEDAVKNNLIEVGDVINVVSEVEVRQGTSDNTETEQPAEA